MKDFVSKKILAFKEYIPGEQAKYIIKLNANENYSSPSPQVDKFLKNYSVKQLRLYPDPQAKELIKSIKKVYGLNKLLGVVVGNGADEIIRGIFTTFFESKRDVVLFTEITYGGYAPYAKLAGVPIKVLPVDDSLQIPLAKISKINAKVVFITNPNNPTGIHLPSRDIIVCVKQNPNKLFVVDEAYVDFNTDSNESCIRYLPLANLLVIKTISKSYSGAGLRLGFAIGDEHLTNSIRKVLDPYNLNVITLELGKIILNDRAYFKKTVKVLIGLRKWLTSQLIERGFEVIPSQANFIFCKPKLAPNRTNSSTSIPKKSKRDLEADNTENLFQFLKKKNIYIRYFQAPKIKKYVRITIGSREELKKLLQEIDAFYKIKTTPAKKRIISRK